VEISLCRVNFIKTALLLDVILYRLTELYQHGRGSSCLIIRDFSFTSQKVAVLIVTGVKT